MAKKRVLVSFDFDNDKTLKDFIIGQSRLPDSPFEVVDTSLKEAAPMRTWEEKARAAINDFGPVAGLGTAGSCRGSVRRHSPTSLGP